MENYEGEHLIKNRALDAKAKLVSVIDAVRSYSSQGQLSLCVKIILSYFKSPEFLNFMEFASSSVTSSLPKSYRTPEISFQDFYLQKNESDLEVSFIKASKEIKGLKIMMADRLRVVFEITATFSPDGSIRIFQGELFDIGLILPSISNLLDEFIIENKN